MTIPMPTPAVVILWSFMLAVASPAQGSRAEESPETPDAREAGMFGEESDSESEDSELEERLANKLQAVDQRLSLGGFLYLRLDTFAQENTQAKTLPLSSPALIDLYLDSRPNDRVRAYVRGRVVHTFTSTAEFGFPTFDSAEATNALLDQLWLKFDIGRVAYITIGKQPIRWGTSRFWNPTDFLHPQTRDPLAVFDARTGVALAKIHFPIESLGANLYAVLNLDGVSSPNNAAGAIRAEWLLGQTEVAISAAKQSGGVLQLGTDISSGIGDFDVRAEAALHHGVEQTFYRPKGDLTNPNWEELATAALAQGDSFDPTALVLETYTRDEAWLLQVSAGADIAIKYSDEDSLIVGAEYFYNQMGYAEPEIYPWLILNNAYPALYVGQHYLAAYIALMAPGSWNDTTFYLNGITNLSDESVLLRLDYRVTILTHLSINAYIGYHTGSIGEFRFGANIPAPFGNLAPSIAAAVSGAGDFSATETEFLENGLTISPQLFDVGVGLRLTF